MRIIPRALLAAGLLVSLSGCLALHAQAPAAVPLRVPDAPSKVVMPPSPDPIPEDVPPTAAPPATSTTPLPGAKPVPPPARPPAGTTPPAGVPPVTAPPPDSVPVTPVLQPVANTGDLEKRIKTQMDSALRDLGKVDPKLLAAEARAQYDWAAQLYRQAEEALKAKNYNYADFLSDKAMRVASALAKSKLSAPTSA